MDHMTIWWLLTMWWLFGCSYSGFLSGTFFTTNTRLGLDEKWWENPQTSWMHQKSMAKISQKNDAGWNHSKKGELVRFFWNLDNLPRCHTLQFFWCTAIFPRKASSCTYARPLTCESCVFFHGLIVADHRWGFLNGARCSPSPVSSHGPKKVQLWLVASWMWFLIQPVASSDSRFSIQDMESPRSFSEVVLVTAVLALGHSSDGNQKLRRFFMLFWGIWSGVPSGNLT